MSQQIFRAGQATTAGLEEGGGSPQSIWIGGRETYNLAAPDLEVGAIEFDPTQYTFSQIRFRAVAARGDAVDAEVELFNFSDSVSVAVLTFSTNNPELQQTVLAVPGDLPAASKIYICRIRLAAAPGVSDSVELFKAELQLVP